MRRLEIQEEIWRDDRRVVRLSRAPARPHQSRRARAAAWEITAPTEHRPPFTTSVFAVSSVVKPKNFGNNAEK